MADEASAKRAIDGRPRVAFLHPSDELYGSDRQLLSIVTIAMKSCRCWVVLPDDVATPGALSAALGELGVPVIVGPMPVLRRPYLRPRRLLPWAVRAAVTNTTALAVGPLAARILGRRHVWWVRELVRSPGWYRRLVRGLGRLPDGELYAISRAVASWIGPMGSHGPRVLVDAVPSSTERVELGPHPRAAFVGRLNEWKGWDVFIRAALVVHRSLPDARFVLAGGTVPTAGGDGTDIDDLIRSADPDGRWLTWVGEVADPRPVMRDAWVVVAPSVRPEPLGNVVLEAMAEGRAAIGTAMGGIPELIADGETGLLVQSTDVAALAEAMTRVLRDRTLADSMGLAGRARFERSFSPEAFESAWSERLEAALMDAANR
jgi:glycosyltransferase involved in cell wall biosynthesis